MKSNFYPWPSAHLVCSLLVSTACLVLCDRFVVPGTSAQRRASSGTAKPSGASQQQDIASLLREATSLLQAGKPEEAEPLVRRAIATAPANADAHNLFGVILDQRGQTEAAEREYLQALRLNPRATSTRANLGILLARTGRADQAIQAFELVLRERPNHPQATLNLGLLCVGRGDYGRAVPLLKRARAQQPNNVALLSHLALALYQLKRIDEASDVVVSAATLAPDDPDVTVLKKCAPPPGKLLPVMNASLEESLPAPPK